MKDRMEVLLDLSSSITKMESIMSQLDIFEKTSGELKSLLEDKSKWAGKSQEKCLQIHGLIDEYEQALRPICEVYKTGIAALIESAEAFDGDSVCVNALKGI